MIKIRSFSFEFTAIMFLAIELMLPFIIITGLSGLVYVFIRTLIICASIIAVLFLLFICVIIYDSYTEKICIIDSSNKIIMYEKNTFSFDDIYEIKYDKCKWNCIPFYYFCKNKSGLLEIKLKDGRKISLYVFYYKYLKLKKIQITTITD